MICVAAFLTAALTLYSGFGLGTLLMPVFALFYPIEVAIAATAVVHAANSVFKIVFAGKHADTGIVLRFGVPAILAAFAGAAALTLVAQLEPIATYAVGSFEAVVTPVKLTVAALMFVFALFELLPGLRHLQFDRKYLVPGGLLSGFFGGFSGHQGALRSAFLVKVGISTEAFVGTNAIIAFLVDLARTSVYAVSFFLAGAGSPIRGGDWTLVLAGALSAFLGVFLGTRYLHKVTMHTVQTLTGILLLGIAFALGAGLI